MARGTGECPIYKRKRKRADGTEYPIYAFDLVMPDGNKKTFYSRVDEKKGDFQKRKNEIMIENQKTVRVSKSFVTVEQHFRNWLAQKRDIENSTRTTYLYAINNYINPIIGKLQLQKVTKDDLNKLISYLSTNGGISTRDGQIVHLKPLSPATLKKTKFILKRAFDYAIENELILKNPVVGIILPKLVKPPIRPFDQAEVQKLITAAKGTSMYIPILVALSTGLRRGELLGLKWQDIDFENGTLIVNRQLVAAKGGVDIKDTLKTTGSRRQVGIPASVLDELKKHKEELEEKAKSSDFINSGIHQDLIVRVDNGKCYDPRNFAHKFDRILKKAGIEKRRVNDMRHTFATLLLSSGAFVSEVQASLGHTDAKTTLTNYSHVLPNGNKMLAAKMDEIMGTSKDSPASPVASVADELMKLSELMKSGVLTEDEFNQQKQILLGNINAEKPSN